MGLVIEMVLTVIFISGNIELPALNGFKTTFSSDTFVYLHYENKNGLNTVEGLNNRENLALCFLF